jgi:GxxExxY protein
MAAVELKYEELTHKIIGCAMKVHTTMGNGFPEVIYQRCHAIEFRKNAILHLREMEMEIFYETEFVGKRRVDFFVDDKIMVELKALKELEPGDISQTLNYLEAYNMEVGLLINFGAPSLQFHRFTNKKYNPSLNRASNRDIHS